MHLLDHSLPKYSGYSFRSRYIVRNLRALGCEVEVCTSARHDVFDAETEEVDGIPHHRTLRPTDAWSGWQLRIPFWRERIMTGAMVKRLGTVARAFRPDLIHAHSPFFNGEAALRVARAQGIPVVYEIRAFWEDDAVDKGKISEDGFVYRQVRSRETRVVQGADGVICICQGLRDDLLGRGLPEDKVVIVKNGVEVETFEPRPKDPQLAARHGLVGKKVLGFIGSFFFYEGLCELVEAAAELAGTRDDFRLLLIGSGEDEANVKRRVADLGLNELVVLPGRVPHEEIQDYYALVDQFIYPRRSKRLTEKVTPLKPLEAMAMERCVLGSDVGGIRELFDECGVGKTYRAGDHGDLVRLLAEALDRDESSLRAEGRRGREAVMALRPWESTLSPTMDLYERLLSGRHGTARSCDPVGVI